MDTSITFGILTVSDTCFNKTKEDTAGPALYEKILDNWITAKIIHQEIVPDEFKEIEKKLISWCLDGRCKIILTTGGTGCSPRDVTPEATKAVIQKEVPGLSHLMLTQSLKITHQAVLSRSVCGIRYRTLIINLPGSKKGATECFDFVVSAIPHAVALINDDLVNVTVVHNALQSQSDPVLDEPSNVIIDNVASRDRHSPWPMKEVDTALNIILNECTEFEMESIPIENALNRVLAEDIYAMEPLPPFRASIKDGYAIRAKAGSGIRKVRANIAAGDMPNDLPLNYDEAVRISTGAPIPEGADAVIQVEDTEISELTPDGKEELKINVLKNVEVGLDIRKIGSDIDVGAKVLQKFDVLSPGHIGVLATVGRTKINVFRRKTIGILSSGNELKTHHESLGPGQVRDCNKLTLINLLKKYNYDGNDCGIVKDEPKSVKNALYKAFTLYDIVITTGGVSMGEFDLIKKVLVQDFGASIHFGRVNMKPGKPTTFATLTFKDTKKFVFGLPGNPVSACVTSILFVLPFLRHMEMKEKYQFPIVKSTLDSPVINNDERPSYVRAEVKFIDGSFTACPTGNQISSRINSLVGANGLILIPGNYKKYSEYETFKTILFNDIVN